MKKILFCLSLLCCSQLFAEDFSFSRDDRLVWQFYGDGVGRYDYKEGHNQKGTLHLSSTPGQTETAFIELKNLENGKYQIEFYLKSKNATPNQDKTNIWHFYQTEYETQDVFRELSGQYDWRKVTYSLNVTQKKVTIWFRALGATEYWVDDFSIKKTTKDSALKIEAPKELVLASKLVKAKNTSIKPEDQTKVLYNFEKDEYGHPFTRRNGVGDFGPQEFYNFQLSDLKKISWNIYDRMEMDVFNPNETLADFNVTLADAKSDSYWNQLNHKQMLAPGWNKISISLKQYVGERGSHKIFRVLDMSQLKKFFVVIDPDKKTNFEKKKFSIDNIRISSNAYPSLPADIYLINFTDQKSVGIPQYTNVSVNDVYSKQSQVGFEKPDFFRVEDSVYASELTRHTIGIKKGSFKISLPNGAYKLKLVANKLGYWDVPFWKDRNLYVNSKIAFKESRADVKDFLKDILQFEHTIPTIKDNPFDLYLNKIFKPIELDAVVNNGVLEIGFEGDVTGFDLNYLIIAKKSKLNELAYFEKELGNHNKKEFYWLTNSLDKPVSSIKQTNKEAIGFVKPSLKLGPYKEEAINTIEQWVSGKNQLNYAIIQIPKTAIAEKVIVEAGEFKNAKNKLKNPKVNLLINQYSSPDMNHETFLLAGKYISELRNNRFSTTPNQSSYVVLTFVTPSEATKGQYESTLSISVGQFKKQLNLKLNVLDLDLKRTSLPMPVGYFGVDPLVYSYYGNKDYENLRQDFRLKAIDYLSLAGFTTFSGLPENEAHLDELLTKAYALGFKTVYSYGGKFPQNYVDDILSSKGTKKESLKNKLKTMLANKKWPKIVYTYSDEAGGYSDSLKADIEKGQLLKKEIPSLSLGGFSSFHSKDLEQLNKLFDYGFYFNVTKEGQKLIQNSKQVWGFYNGAPTNLDDPRFSFGPGLYIARMNGLGQYLEWHSSANYNYPYYDFDGRESDVVLFYPQTNGTLELSLRYLMSTEAIAFYKKLSYLESAAKNSAELKGQLSQMKNELVKNASVFGDKNYMSQRKTVDFEALNTKLNKLLLQLP